MLNYQFVPSDEPDLTDDETIVTCNGVQVCRIQHCLGGGFHINKDLYENGELYAIELLAAFETLVGARKWCRQMFGSEVEKSNCTLN